MLNLLTGICNKLPLIENGAITCNDSSYFQSTCQASCDKHYKLVGYETIKCIKYSDNIFRWNKKPPSCKSKLFSFRYFVFNSFFNLFETSY